MGAEQQIEWDVDAQDQGRHVRHAAAEGGERPAGGSHAAPEGADVHPLIDLTRDPNPGVPNHAAPDEDD